MGVIEDELSTRSVVGRFTPDMARELAISQKVCVRPLIRRLIDRDTNTEQYVALPCGSTRDAICPPCAHKAKVLRMQQCATGWHRADEPEHQPITDQNRADDEQPDEAEDELTGDDDQERRVRSTRRRDDAADLPRVPVEDRTIGRVFTAPDGQEYRPSMFLTLTLPSYGPIRPGSHGIPASPRSYDYRRAALDALHFAKLLDRFWQNLRRCAGYNVQYFAAVEPQARIAPHLHAAIRGAIPRDILRQVIKATYVQVWWPPQDQVVYGSDDRGDTAQLPHWTGAGYADPVTGAMLPTWAQALDRLATDPDGRPVHVMRFGTQTDMRGIVAPSVEADRAVRYLTKYLTKAIADPLTGAKTDGSDQTETIVDHGREAHIDRLHAELRYLPCSPTCANWLRYGVQPKDPTPGLRPGWCASKAHDRDHLGLGGRRVLVSRQWSGKL